MATEAQWISFGDKFTGYLARPSRAAGPLPGVVVIQEAWGVDEHIEDVTRRIAQAGYVALAPDVFARDGERPAPLGKARLAETVAFVNDLPPGAMMDPPARDAALAKRPAAEQARLRETMTTLFAALGDVGRNLPPVLGAAAHLRAQPSTGQAVFTVGFCMGGGLSGLAACHDPALAAAVIFYGSAPPAEKIASIRCPVLAFHGSLDKRLVDGLPAFEAAMKQHGKSLEAHVYDGAQHAFFNDNRPSYDARATRQSFARLLAFFAGLAK